MAKRLDEAEGRAELRAIAGDLGAARSRMRALLARVKRTRGFHRWRRALGAIHPDATLPPVSLPSRWAGHLEVALGAVEEAIRELRMSSGGRRRRG